MGLGAAIILFIGLMSLGSSRNEFSTVSSKEFKQWYFTEDSVYTAPRSQTILLDKNMMFDINLYIKFGKEKKSNQFIPVSAYCTRTGVISGFEWMPQTITLNTDSSGSKLEYEVYGNLKWKLLNGTIYTGYKNYKGSIAVK